MSLPGDSTTRFARQIVRSRCVRPRSLLLSVLFCLVLFALLAWYARWTVWRYAKLHDPEEILRTAIGEADRLDPGWRREDLQAKRAVIPDADNSALCVLAARERLPKDWPTWRSLDRLVGRELDRQARWKYENGIRWLSPAVQFNAQQLAILQAELREADDALAEARKLSELPCGRFPLGKPNKPLIPTPSPPINPHTRKARELIDLLSFDVWVRTQQGDFANALASCRAIVNAGLAVGDELDSTAQLIRFSCAVKALRRLERVLAQGDSPPADLQRMQRLLEDEAEVPSLLILARGERAGSYFVLEGIQQGRYSAEEIANIDKVEDFTRNLISGLRSAAGDEEMKEAEENPIKWHAPERIIFSRIWTLRFTNAFVEICKRPDWEQAEALGQLKTTLKGQPYSSQLFGEGLIHVQTGYGRTRAELRCAAVALAVERYRQANGRWPDSLNTLVPGQLKAVPRDPFDGHPLRYRREAQGIVIYSIGRDGKDDGGYFRMPNMDLDRDVGFRLWHPQWRRQPPPPIQPPNQIAEPEDADPQ